MENFSQTNSFLVNLVFVQGKLLLTFDFEMNVKPNYEVLLNNIRPDIECTRIVEEFSYEYLYER